MSVGATRAEFWSRLIRERECVREKKRRKQKGGATEETLGRKRLGDGGYWMRGEHN